MSSVAWAGTYTFKPKPVDMYDLYHPYCYSWAIDLGAKGFDPAAEGIVSASITFHQINNWTQETNTLFVTLMDPTASVSTGTAVYNDYTNDEAASHTPDNEWTLEDSTGKWKLKPGMFSDRYELGTYSDQDGHYGNVAPFSDVTMTFSPTAVGVLNGYAADGRIAIGFDPDCHYFNSGIDLTITTGERPNVPESVVPEPFSVFLGMMGLASVAGFRRLRK